jgi:VCBS repeat-containing protein
MAIDLQNDSKYILEDASSVNGNVLTNDVSNPNTTSDILVKPGSLKSINNNNTGDNNGDVVGEYGILHLNSDGTYTYTLTADMNYLGAGVDVQEKFEFRVEKANGDNINDPQNPERLTITIHGENDKVHISDVAVTGYEGANGDVLVYDNGQLAIDDLPGQPAGTKDLDSGDTYTYQKVGTETWTSSDVDPALLTGVDVTVNPNGTYSVTGDFDALAVGETATVTFQYQVKEHSTGGSDSLSDPKTVTLTVVGQNDGCSIVDDYIYDYTDLKDGDIYKSILANDTDPDVNDVLKITDTTITDIDFYNGGGTISVDNAAKTLEYTPGDGGAIAAEHFKFEYTATDGYTDPKTATVDIDMVFRDATGENNEIDFYKFGGAGDDTIGGVDGKNNVLSGMGGNDYIRGKEANDIMYGGDGQDRIHGGWGNDLYIGGKGNDGFVDTRGADIYVFSKGDGRDIINDYDLEIYQDAMGHDDINFRNYSNVVEQNPNRSMAWYEEHADIDIVRFDSTINRKDIAFFQKDNEYKSLEIRYNKDDSGDEVSIGWQPEDHLGIERIEYIDAQGDTYYLDKAAIDDIITKIATYDMDDNTPGIQTAQSMEDVQGNAYLMDYIYTHWAQ